jgi:DNA-3-methyladenine glycosylase
MSKARNIDDVQLLTSGPGRLTQALGITLFHNGLDMTDPASGLWIEDGDRREAVATARVGITRATDRMWRFVDPSSAFISRKLRATSASLGVKTSSLTGFLLDSGSRRRWNA